MIPAKRSPWFTRIFARHACARIRAAFGRVFIAGLPALTVASRERPLLVVANHTAWWDPLVALYLARRANLDAYAMMDAKNLRQLPFFGRVGAFGVDLDDGADGARAIRYAAKLLDRPGRAVWIYPQGRERPPFGRLELRPGAAQVARVAKNAWLVPVGVRYLHGPREQPDLWIAIGPARPAPRNVDDGVAAQASGIGDQLAQIDDAVASGDARDFDLASERRPGFFAAFAERSLALLTR